MKAVSQRIDGDIGRHVTVSVQEDVAKRCVDVLARTVPVSEVFLSRTRITTEPCDWCASWWARLIRWACSRRWTHRLVPRLLEELAFATVVSAQCSREQLPEAVWDSIQAQIASMLMRGQTPTLILVGRGVALELHAKHFDLMRPCFGFWPETELRSLGYKMMVTPKLADNVAIVV